MKSVDTLSRTIDPTTNILRSERLITCEQPAPAWVRSLLGDCTSHVHEISYVDPASKKVTMVSTNLTWSNLLKVREMVTYSPLLAHHKSTSGSGSIEGQDHERTKFEQEAQITAVCGGWEKLKRKIEEASVERFGENARKGREGFESVLRMGRWDFRNERQGA